MSDDKNKNQKPKQPKPIFNPLFKEDDLKKWWALQIRRANKTKTG